jgi:DNA uptake protein ComE-like DNA-binding protein
LFVKEFFNSLFGISSKEINGLSLLILLLVIVLLVPKVINYFTGSGKAYTIEDARILDSLATMLEDYGKSLPELEHSPRKIFEFDPNRASPDDFLLLGFNEKISNRIINYRNKGGTFKVKKDLLKIYGIDSSLVISLYSSINLPTNKARSKSLIESNSINDVRPKQMPIKQKLKELPDFDINLADTSMLQTINGIGSILSTRIIEFRDNLGGLVDINQLYEVYNLDTIVANRLMNKIYIATSFKPNSLLINEISEAQLAAHPYISWKQARLIIAYRNQHGNFTSSADLLKVYSVDEDLIEKITPYLVWTPAN